MEEQISNIEEQEVVEAETVKESSQKPVKKIILYASLILLIVLAGVGTGWLLAGKPSKKTKEGSMVSSGVVPGVKTGPKEAGIADEATFRDSAEGVLKSGGVDGEGTHHLDRGLGPEKDVYLTSTVINLDDFLDKKVKVWGETISAQKAGWLMDVGKIKVIE